MDSCFRRNDEWGVGGDWGVGWVTLTLALSLRERGLPPMDGWFCGDDEEVGGLVGLGWGGVGLSGADGFYYESFEGADLAGESLLVVFDGPEADVEFFHVGSHFFSEFVHLLPESGEVGPHLFTEFGPLGSHPVSEFMHLLFEFGEVGPYLLFEFGEVGSYLLFEFGEVGAHLLAEFRLAAFEGGYVSVDLPY